MFDPLKSVLEKQVLAKYLRFLLIATCVIPGIAGVIVFFHEKTGIAVAGMSISLLSCAGGLVATVFIPSPRFPKDTHVYRIKRESQETPSIVLHVPGEDAFFVERPIHKRHLRGMVRQRNLTERSGQYDIEPVKKVTVPLAEGKTEQDTPRRLCIVIFRSDVSPESAITSLLNEQGTNSVSLDAALMNRADKVAALYSKSLSEADFNAEIVAIAEETRTSTGYKLKHYSLLNSPEKPAPAPDSTSEA